MCRNKNLVKLIIVYNRTIQNFRTNFAWFINAMCVSFLIIVNQITQARSFYNNYNK